MSTKLTQQEVEKIFFDEGCELLESKYINNKTSMKYRCSCGNKSEIRLDTFKRGHRCAKCGGNEKHNFEYVYNSFKEQGCELLETEYINNITPMRYKCNCGNKSLTSFSNFQRDRRCAKCGGNEKLTYEQVCNHFKGEGYELLETEYINNYTKMKYRCKCGCESISSFNNFQQGYRCKQCWLEKNFGETHSRWNPNREEIPLNLRLRNPHSKKWIQNHMKSDPNYNNFIKDPDSYVVDHIIPVKLFSKLTVKYNLNEVEVKSAINKRKNIQLLTWKDNSAKGSKGSLKEAKQFLLEHGIQLED
jgi:hypothetical protein